MIENQPKPDWQPLPRDGCVNVEVRVLLSKEGLSVANLRFSQDSTIDPRDAAWDIDVVCLSGSGFTRIDSDVFEISAGQTIRWPASKIHCLWTDNTEMETLMVERHGT